MKIQKYVRLLSLVVLLASSISISQPARASTNSVDRLDTRISDRSLPVLQDIIQDQPTVSVVVNPPSMNIGEAAIAKVNLNNVPAEGYSSIELTCSYDPNMVEATNIVVASLFGIDPVTAINGPQGGRFIVAIVGSSGNKAINSGTVIAFSVRGRQAGQTALECKARVPQGDNTLTEIQSTAANLTILGSTPTPTLQPTLCDQAQFVADINIPDGTVFSPGATFIKTWRLKNVGSCVWTTSYKIVFDSGEQMKAPPSSHLPVNVPPGQTVDISVPMTAPTVAGSYRSYWMFQNANGALFGTGSQANRPWWMDIRVSGASATPGGPTITPSLTPTPTIKPVPCDKAEFIADVSVPPGTVMGPGAQFQKTWRLTNVGACTWTRSYQLVFFSGEQMGAVASAFFPVNVAPGQTVNLSLNMTAPSVPGPYRGYWMFKNANGALFGIGPQANEPWFVDIVVSGATPTPTIVPAPCDKAEFIADVSIPPGTVMTPGAQFKKTWRFKNVGTCTWTRSYRIAFYSGEQMGALSSMQFPLNVAPGQMVDLSLNMTASATVGSYRGYWIFQNETGGLFGVGGLGNDPWFVDIVVSNATVTPGPTYTQSPTPSVTPGGPTATPISGVAYDFAANACEATWFSGAGQLPCPGIDGNPNGFVLKMNNPKLENGTVDTRPGILTFPQNIQDGYIQGFYPPFHVQNGDRFRGTIGCDFGATSCYVGFRLDYQTGTDPIRTFWGPFRERYEGQQYSPDIDLSPLAGKDVRFILTVLSSGTATGDRALWVGPIIHRTGGSSDTPAPTNTPTPSPTTGVSTYQNTKYSFKFTLPAGAAIVSQTDNDGRVNLPLAPGTNLLEKYLLVNVTENANPCVSPVVSGSIASTENIFINNIPFTKQTGQGVALSNIYDWVAYSTVRNNACISLAFILKSINPGTYATPPPLFDPNAEAVVFTQIMSTFAWLESPAATPSFTPTPVFTLTPFNSPTSDPQIFGMLTGQVLAGKQVNISLFDTNQRLVISVDANSDGTYSITAPAGGTYTVIATAPGHLRAQGNATVTTNTTTTMPTISLLPGDIDGNDVIDPFDALTIGMNYNAATPTAADLNNDGIINVLDLELLAQNYRDTGPVAWQ